MSLWHSSKMSLNDIRQVGGQKSTNGPGRQGRKERDRVMRQRHQPALQKLKDIISPRSGERFLKRIDRHEDLDDLLAAVLTVGLRGVPSEQFIDIIGTLRKLPIKRKRLVLCLLMSPQRQASVTDLRSDLYGPECNDNRSLNKLFADTKERLAELPYKLFPNLCLFQVATVPRRGKRYRRLDMHPTLRFTFQDAASSVYAANLKSRDTWKLARRPASESPKAQPIETPPTSEQMVPMEVHLRLMALYEGAQEELRTLRLRVRHLEQLVVNLGALEKTPDPNKVLRRNLPA